MTADFLLELRCEEIPARMQARASEDLARLFTEKLAEAGLKPGKITSYVTPRRLALIAHDLPLATQAVSEEYKGPRTSAPAQALEGFLRKTGLTQDQLEDRDGIWFAAVEKPGRATADVLAEAIPAIVRAFPWPKSMRWGDASASTESLRWVRPLQGIIALLGEDVVDFSIDDVRSGAATMGHRFHHSGPITIGSANDYVEKLRACHVIVDQTERASIIETRANALAQEAGLELIPDAGLVAENAGLTEWPVPLLGRFDAAFLEVPPEVIQLTLRINQKYFVLRNPPRHGEGDQDAQRHGGGGSPTGATLANAFICTANIDAKDGGKAIVEGNGKVLAARLSDARFFWEQDKKTPLAEQAKKLSRITFHEKLGTVADKVERVAKLARWLVEEGIVKPQDSATQNSSPARGGGPAANADGGGGAPDSEASTANPLHHHPTADVGRSSAPPSNPPRTGEDRAALATLAEQAARLCKADLVTEMVGEFPELQGLMGGYYARAEGLPDAVADAIRDHYKPVGQSDDVPTAPVTVAVSLADKLDTLASFFLIDERPTGSKDPFALRRAGIAIGRLIVERSLRTNLAPTVMKAMFGVIGQQFTKRTEAVYAEVEPALKHLTDDKLVVEVLRDLAPKSAIPIDDAGTLPVEQRHREQAATLVELVMFLLDRLKVQQREAGVRHDLIDAVFALGGEDDLVRLLARVKALQSFVSTDDGVNLLAGYKRAANILKKENWADHHAVAGPTGDEDGLVAVDDPQLAEAIQVHEARFALNYTPEPAEAALIAALDMAGPRADAAVAAEDFGAAMAALATLRGPIDAFFEAVTVNDPDPAKRESRLNLLTRIRAAVHKVADFSKIEG